MPRRLACRRRVRRLRRRRHRACTSILKLPVTTCTGSRKSRIRAAGSAPDHGRDRGRRVDGPRASPTAPCLRRAPTSMAATPTTGATAPCSSLISRCCCAASAPCAKPASPTSRRQRSRASSKNSLVSPMPAHPRRTHRARRRTPSALVDTRRTVRGQGASSRVELAASRRAAHGTRRCLPQSLARLSRRHRDVASRHAAPHPLFRRRHARRRTSTARPRSRRSPRRCLALADADGNLPEAEDSSAPRSDVLAQTMRVLLLTNARGRHRCRTRRERTLHVSMRTAGCRFAST